MFRKPCTLKSRLLGNLSLVVLALIALSAVIGVSIAQIASTKDRISKETAELSSLYSAKAGHYNWSTSLSNYLNYGIEFSGSTDPTKCVLGQCLYDTNNNSDPTFQTFLTAVEPVHNDLHAAGQEILELAKNGKVSEAKTRYTGEILPMVESLVSTLDERIEAINQLLADENQTLSFLMVVSVTSTLVALVIVLIVLVFLFLFLKKEVLENLHVLSDRIGRLASGNLTLDLPEENTLASVEMRNIRNSLADSVSELAKYIEVIDLGMEYFSKGDFTQSCPIEFRGDFVNIRRSMERFQEKMNASLARMDVSAGYVSSGASQVADSAQTLAQGATEQASSVEELSATINEISIRLSETAEYSKAADALGKRAGEVVLRSQTEMTQLVEAIKNIAVGAKNIQKIIKVIDDIAFQTNILALNAAVEAARAGVAGKGFAVVADEVRNLAQKSAEAAQNTTALIEESLHSVSVGEQLSDNTQAAFNEMADYANQTVDMIEKIAHASEEQAQAVAQISQGIDQISSVVQMNSATSEESAAASEELSSEANQMKALLDQFIIRANSDDEAHTESSAFSSKHTAQSNAGSSESDFLEEPSKY